MEMTIKHKGMRQWRDLPARQRCEKSRELERASDYEGARSALGGLWSCRPKGQVPGVRFLPIARWEQ